MPTSKSDNAKLKSNLKLCSSRMGLLQKKKTELGHKARREIADLIKANKIERSRIKTEQIVREDYVVEAMEILQTYCELIISRFGIFEAKNEVDPALETAISTLIWATPRLSAEVNELEVIKKLFAMKYSKSYVDSCLGNKLNTVNDAVIQRLGLMTPSSQLVELYMVEIAKTYEVPYEANASLLENAAGVYEMDIIGAGSSNVGGDVGDMEKKLLDFDPSADNGLPELPEGFTTIDKPWDHGQPTDLAPYPENTPFPTSDPLPPPVPTQGPVPPDRASYFGIDAKPPSYDAAVFSEKPIPPTNAQSGTSTPPPGFLGDPPNETASSSSESEPDEQDFDELQRRFNELTKKN